MAKKSKQNKTPKKKGASESPSKKKTTTQKYSSKVVSNYEGKLSLVIPLYNESDRLHYLKEALTQFDKRWETPYEVILVNDGSSDNTLQLLQDSYAEANTEKTTYQVLDLGKNQGKGAALKAGIATASGDHILTLDADMASKPTELIQWLKKLPQHNFPNETILIASREHKNSNVNGKNQRRGLGLLFNYWIQILTGFNISDTQCGFKLYPKAIAKKLFAQMSTKGWAHDVELLYSAELLDIPIQEMPITWTEVENSKVSVFSDGIKMAFTALGIYFKANFKHFFINPIKHRQQTIEGKESDWYRFGFAILALLLLIMMPILSFDYGITGDEDVQRIYGQHVLNYYESGGEDDQALTYRNLYYYGGLFDYYTAWFHKYVFSWDTYDTRHFLNSLTGVALMIFVGLTARVVTSSWLVGLLALLFVALSPRVFGHSMNNPKDIPFAAGSMMTIYFMVNFLKQLPKPSIKHILGLILGIAISINIRVGGILLIAYLGLFTGIMLVTTAKLRTVGTFLRVGITGAIIVLLGYLGGMLYWPYGALAPFENPLKALSEMSNFSTGIRVLFNGDNVWSDKVPSSYIPVWFMVTTPLMVLLGTIMSLIFSWINRKKINKLTLGLIWFIGLFPPIYAISQDSALYDGIRHMLFAYVAFPILAAIGWAGALNMTKKAKGLHIAVIGVVTVLSFLPLKFMIFNHPYQYIYFNEIQGNTAGANNNFEMDYWMTSMRGLTEYFLENEYNPEDTVYIATNCMVPVEYYLVRAEKRPNIKLKYVRFHEREKHNWDYAFFFGRFIDDKFLKNGIWPTQPVLHEEKVDGITIGYLTKRASKDGYKAQIAVNKKNYPEAIRLLQGVIEKDPKNESALIMLIQATAQSAKFELMKTYCEQLIGLSNEYSNGLGLMGIYYLNTKNTAKATEFLEKAVSFNYKYTFGHYHLARILASEKNYAKAMEHLELFDANGGKPAAGYNLAIQVAQATKDNTRLYYFQAKTLAAQGKINESYQMVGNSLKIDATYAPAVKLQKQYDDQIEKQRKEALRQKSKSKK